MIDSSTTEQTRIDKQTAPATMLESALDCMQGTSNSREAFFELSVWSQRSATAGVPADVVERQVFDAGMELLRRMLEENLNARGGSVQARAVEEAQASGKLVVLSHRREHARNYESLFGTVRIHRLGYGAPGQRSIHPLDEELNLPPRKYSYPLVEKFARRASRGPFDEALEELGSNCGGQLPKRQSEELLKEAACDFEQFYAERGAQSEASGSVLVAGVDCKGVPRRRSAEEKAKQSKQPGPGQEKKKKRMATVASVHTSEPHYRKPEEIVANLLDDDVRKSARSSRPRPENRRLWASLHQSKTDIFMAMAEEMWARDPQGVKRALCVMDGEKSLNEGVLKVLRGFFPNLLVILDIMHVLSYLWKASYCFEEKGSEEARLWVRARLLRLLQGEVMEVVEEMCRSASIGGLSNEQEETVYLAAQYFENHKHMMCYDEYLAQGLPIASGCAEGACGHLVKDRMELTGALWDVDNGTAEAVLKLRALDKSGDLDEYWRYHTEKEHSRNHNRKWKAAA